MSKTSTIALTTPTLPLERAERQKYIWEYVKLEKKVLRI